MKDKMSKIHIYHQLNLFLKDFIYLFLDGGEGREKERNINVWLPLMYPLLVTWPTAQACALTGNKTVNPLVCRPVLNPPSHTSQGSAIESHANKKTVACILRALINY